MRDLARRLDALEASGTPSVVVCWVGVDETPEQALARRFPAGSPAGVKLLFVRWQTGDGATA